MPAAHVPALRTSSSPNERTAPDTNDLRRSRTFSGHAEASQLVADPMARAGP